MQPSSDPALPRSRTLRIAPLFLAIALFLSHAPSILAAPAAGEGSHEADLNGIGWKLLFVAILVLLNGFFVASEFALVAVRRTRIDQLAAEGSSAAKIVQHQLKDLDRYIAATQVGITVASLILGGVGETTFHALFLPLLKWVPEGLPAGITGSVIAVGLAYFLMTALHVIIGELMPKSIALQLTDRTVLLIARPMTFFGQIFSPLIWLLNGTGRFLLSRLGLSASEEHGSVHSPEELDLLVSQSHLGGELNDTEAEILHRVVRFSDLTLREVMVPRVEMQALPVEMPRLALRAWIHSRPHSRVPVYAGTMDDVIGLVHLKDLVPFTAKLGPGDDDELISLMPLVRETLRLPETSTVDKLLVQFKKTRQQLAIVIDEFGGTAGMVTLGDLLDQVFGEMADEFDTPEPEIAQSEGGRISLPGRTLIEEINLRFETGFRQDEADTVAGLVLTELGRPAKVGDEVLINGVQIRVEAVERIRITRVSLMLPEAIEREKEREREATLEAA
ncbi:HlyC/CorC family transporter [bacterium]|nr:MAG: HlyC/CorC family transporter [bacterium]